MCCTNVYHFQANQAGNSVEVDVLHNHIRRFVLHRHGILWQSLDEKHLNVPSFIVIGQSLQELIDDGYIQ